MQEYVQDHHAFKWKVCLFKKKIWGSFDEFDKTLLGNLWGILKVKSKEFPSRVMTFLSNSMNDLNFFDFQIKTIARNEKKSWNFKKCLSKQKLF